MRSVKIALALAVPLGALPMACGSSSSSPASGGNSSSDGSVDASSGDDVGILVLPDATRPMDAASAPDVLSETSTAITISGHAVEAALPTNPIPSRAVTIRDANGIITALVTDASGSFRAAGVAPPYDVVVGGDGENAPPYAYLGISTPDPQLSASLSTSATGTCVTYTATIPLAFTLPDCGSATCSLAIEIDSSGMEFPVDGFVGSYTSARLSYSYPTQIQWCGASSINVDVLALTSDTAKTKFAYVDYPVFGITGGSTAATTPIAPTTVPTLGPITVTATGVGIPQSWGLPTTGIYFNFPMSGAYWLAETQATSIVVGVPDILGASIVTQAGYGNSTEGTTISSLMLPLSTTTSALTVPAPPTITAPLNGAQISSSGTVAWTALPSDEIALIAISSSVDAGPQATWALLYTNESSLDLGRLAAMGLTFPSAAAELDLYGSGKIASLDAMVDAHILATLDYTIRSETITKFTFTP